MESPELFIGREKMRRFLLDEIFLSSEWTPKFCPIVAPCGFGKTELMGAVVRDFESQRPANVFHFFKNCEPGEGYLEFWIDLLRRITASINAESLADRAGSTNEDAAQALLDIEIERVNLEHLTPNQKEPSYLREKLDQTRKTLFSAYTLLGICIVITVDDFDRAHRADPDIYDSLAELERGSYPVRRNNVSVILLSRVWLHSQKEEDEFESHIAPFYLGGFSNSELEAYFASYAELPCGLPSRELQMRILYLCGRSPELLMRTRHNLSGKKRINGMDLTAIFDTDRRFYEHTCYRQLFMMRGTWADDWRIDTLEALFARHLIRADQTSAADAREALEHLHCNGMVTRESADGNLYERLGIAIPPSVAQTRTRFLYEPIAPFLLDFLRTECRES